MYIYKSAEIKMKKERHTHWLGKVWAGTTRKSQSSQKLKYFAQPITKSQQHEAQSHRQEETMLPTRGPYQRAIINLSGNGITYWILQWVETSCVYPLHTYRPRRRIARYKTEVSYDPLLWSTSLKLTRKGETDPRSFIK